MKTAFEPIVDAKSKILILGTMPGEKSLELQQYYGHAGNHFWKIMFHLFDGEFTKDYQVRTQLLKTKRIALWDVLSHCEGKGSADSDIKNEIPNDFEVFHQQYPAIKTIIFASKQAEKFYTKYAQKLEDVSYYTFPSPSGANATKSLAEKTAEWKLILKLLEA